MISQEQVLAESLLENKEAETRITIRNYGKYSSSNYGAHTICLSVGPLQFYFSYQTVIAFSDEEGFYVCENPSGPTTGKHLNWIDRDKKSRFSTKEFEGKLHKTLLLHGLSI